MIRAALYCLAALSLAASAQALPLLEDYGKLPGIDEVTLSPNGQRYAFVATVGEERRLIVADANNQIIEQDNVGTAKVVDVQWAGDDHLLVEISATVAMDMEFSRMRDELRSCIVINPNTHKSFAVFGNSNKVAHTIGGMYGARQVDGVWYGYFGGYTYDRGMVATRIKAAEDGLVYASLYRVNLDTGDVSLVADDDGQSTTWLVAPAGDVAANIRFNRKSGAWKALAAPRASIELASGTYPDVDGEIIGYGHDASKVLIGLTTDDGEKIIEEPLAGGQPNSTYDAEKLGQLLFDRRSRMWIGSIKDQTPALFDPARQAKLRGALAAFPGYIPRLTSYSEDFSKMIVLTEGGDDSGTYWIVDTAARSAKPLGYPYPSVKPGDVGPIRWFDYKAGDGLAISAVLTLPPGRAAKALPLVVMPHGGPHAHDWLRFDYWAQAFASRGYAVLQPNFRGSTDKGVDFERAGAGQWGRKMQTDLSDGVAELARQGVIDPKRVCIVGASYGGYAALAGVTVQHGLYKCAVSVGGVADLTAQYRYVAESSSAASVTARAWKADLGLASSEGNRLEDVSPIRLADRADAPVLLIHGKDDTVVLPDQSDDMEKALRTAGKDVKLVSVPDADHWWLHENTRIVMVKESVNFVLAHNPPDPAKAASEKQ
jgi:dipeptidyl aminopeptidase/acylaminoacyl peptidase